VTIHWEVEVLGLKELDQALKELPTALQKTVLTKGVERAGGVIQQGMVRRVTRAAVHRIERRGQRYPKPLFEEIKVRVRVDRDGDVVALVGPSKKAFWGRFVELGTRSQPARPFMRPALDEDGQLAVTAFATGAREELETVVRRVRIT
jgi:HK97 gp10 family phage protein